jgi:oligosaccharide repeat unit polymerase
MIWSARIDPEGGHSPPGRISGFARQDTIAQYLMVHAGVVVIVGAICTSLAAGLVPSISASSVLFAACIVWMLFSWAQVVRSILSPYWLFVLVASLFNGGHAFLQLFGANPNGVMDSAFSNLTTSSTILYTTLSMMLLHLGALWRIAREPEHAGGPEGIDQEKGATRLGLLLILISIVPVFLELREDLGAVLNGGYFGLYQREVRTNIDAWQSILAQFMLPGTLLLAAASRNQRFLRRFSFFIVTAYALSFMFLGYRGAAGATIAAFGWVWHTRVRKLPLYPSLAAGILVVFVLFPMIRSHRSTSGDDRLSLKAFANTLEDYDNPAIASMSEMGGTMSTIAYTLDLVPGDREFEYGQSYLFAALTVVPNIFGTPLHPAIEHGRAADWLVRTVHYEDAASGGGLGYSFVAESYLNFGWMGPLVMIAMGFLIAAAECFAARSASPAAATLMGVILYCALIYARSETSTIVRPIVWGGFLPLGVLALFAESKGVKRLLSSVRSPLLGALPVSGSEKARF